MLKPEVASALDKAYGPRETLFRITSVPAGGAPAEIRQQWVDLALPVRKLYAARFMFGYIGRRFLPTPEDFSNIDAITGKLTETTHIWGPVEVRGYDAVDSLENAGRAEAAQFWAPYSEALLSFSLYDGAFDQLASEALNR